MRKPNLFIVGAPKCGTSAMHYYLGQHPEVFMASGPEPHFFGRDVSFSWFPKLNEKTYLELFAAEKGEKIVGEKSTSYLASECAAREIRQFSPGARIIAMLRNPVDMVYSLHNELVYMGVEEIREFRKALSVGAEPAVDRHGNTANATSHTARIYRESVRYSTQLRRYFGEFGRDRVHVVIFDDLRRDTTAAYAETLRFLEVDADFQPDLRVVNPNKRLRSTLVAHPPSFLRSIAKAMLPRSLRRGVYGQISLLNTSHKPRPAMDPELRAKLQRKFAPEVERVSELLNRDLSHWTTRAR